MDIVNRIKNLIAIKTGISKTIDVRRDYPHLQTGVTSASSTNYDPFDPDQTRSSPDGRGAAMAMMKEDMIAVPRKPGTQEPVVPYGTVIYIPEFKRNFLVADLKGEAKDPKDVRFDFPTPHKGKWRSPAHNKPFSYRILERGKENEDWGKADARAKAASGAWRNIKPINAPEHTARDPVLSTMQQAKSVVEAGGSAGRFGEFTNVLFREVAPSKLRNDQSDDYFMKKDGGVEVLIDKSLSELDKKKMKIHALIEANYLKKHGTSFDTVTKFDAKHKNSPQPGERKDAPYFVEHALANKAEKLFRRGA